MATVYRFQTWDITEDRFRRSERWATAEAIERVRGQPISEGVEVDDHYLGGEVDGMSARGFDPSQPPQSGFPNHVK